MWDKITDPFSNSPLKIVYGYVISSHTLLGMWLRIHDGIQDNPC